MNKVSLIWRIVLLFYISTSAGCFIHMEPAQSYVSFYNNCNTSIVNDSGGMHSLDSGQRKSFTIPAPWSPADFVPTYTVDGKSYPFHLEVDDDKYKYTAYYEKSEAERYFTHFDNECATAIEAQHNDGTSRVFSLKPKENKRFIVYGEYSPSYTLKGKSYPFHKEKVGSRSHTYTACYDELKQKYHVKFYNKCATEIEAQYNDGTISFSLEPEERAGYLISVKDSLSYTLKGKSHLFHKEKVGNLSNSYTTTACYDE